MRQKWENRACTEGKGVFWKSQRDSEKSTMLWSFDEAVFAMQTTGKRATPTSNAEKVKGKGLIPVLATEACPVSQPYPLPPARG